MGISTYKTKTGKRYRAELYLKGARVSFQAGFETKKEAKAWLVEEERRLVAPLPPKTGTDFYHLASLYLDDMEARRQHNTYVGKKSVIKRFLEHMGGAFILEKLSPSDIDSFLVQRKTDAGAKAANRDLLELKAVLNWAIRKDLYQRNPFRLAEKFSEDKYIRLVPTADEINKIRLVAQRHERDFIDTLYFTGGRLSEICNLTWEDLNFEKRTITLWTRKRREGSLEPRLLAMVDRLHSILWGRWNSPDRHRTHVFFYPKTRVVLKKNHPCARYGTKAMRAGRDNKIHCSLYPSSRSHAPERFKESNSFSDKRISWA